MTSLQPSTTSRWQVDRLRPSSQTQMEVLGHLRLQLLRHNKISHSYLWWDKCRKWVNNSKWWTLSNRHLIILWACNSSNHNSISSNNPINKCSHSSINSHKPWDNNSNSQCNNSQVWGALAVSNSLSNHHLKLNHQSSLKTNSDRTRLQIALGLSSQLRHSNSQPNKKRMYLKMGSLILVI